MKKGTRQRGVGNTVLSSRDRLIARPKLTPSKVARREIPARDRLPIGKFEGSRSTAPALELEHDEAELLRRGAVGRHPASSERAVRSIGQESSGLPADCCAPEVNTSGILGCEREKVSTGAGRCF